MHHIRPFQNFPWISSFLSLDNCSSVSTSETRFSILFREDAWRLLQTDLDCNWLEAGGFASMTVAAQACSTAGGTFFVQVLCRWTSASYSFLHRGSAEFLRRSMRTICICFQKVTRFVICRPVTCLSRLPKKQDWGVRRTWKTRPVLQKLCWNGLQMSSRRWRWDQVRWSTNSSWQRLCVGTAKVTCFRQMLRAHQPGGATHFQLRHSSHDFGWQSSHSVDLAGWQAKMASIEIWIPWCNAHKPHFRKLHFSCFVNTNFRKLWPSFNQNMYPKASKK